MLEKGIEPSRDKSHRILSPSRLPVPTLQHVVDSVTLANCRRVTQPLVVSTSTKCVTHLDVGNFCQ